jgi:hypothetical protein
MHQLTPLASVNGTQSPSHGNNNDITLAVHCPHCRSDLSGTICDTLLLRKVYECQHSSSFDPVRAQRESLRDDVSPEQSTTSSLERMEFRHVAADDPVLAREIAAAREREGQFWEHKESLAWHKQQQQQQQHHSPKSVASLVSEESHGSDKQEIDDSRETDALASNPTPANASSPMHEEWGLEVDVRTGVHESMKLPPHQQLASPSQRPPDPTLLAGLDGAMPVGEQKAITRLLSSGDTSELALAAIRLAKVADQVRRQQGESLASSLRGSGSREAAATSRVELVASNTDAKQTILMTVYQLIDAGKKARRKAVLSNSPTQRQRASSADYEWRPQSRYTKLATVKAAQHRLVDEELRAKLARLKRHPLPSRLPKYCEFTIPFNAVSMSDAHHIVKCLPFRFCNDTWDGTVMDAFYKISVKDARPKLPAGKNYAPTPVTYRTFVDDHYKVHYHRRRPVFDEGVRAIMGWYDTNGKGGCGDMRLDTPHPRVLIASVVDPNNNNHQLDDALVISGSVIVPGDVVTHLNGVELRDVTVDDLIARICSLCYSSSTSRLESQFPVSSMARDQDTEIATVRLGFVLNADRAIAKALHMRATAIHSLYYD